MSINYAKQEEEIVALNYALNILKVGFEHVPQIDGVLYVDGIPEVVRTLLKTQMDYRHVQTRIYHVSQKTGLTIESVRKLLKTKTLSELEAFERIDGKIVFHDLIKVQPAE